MLPLKWKIYRVINYVQLVISSVILIMLFSLAYNSVESQDINWFMIAAVVLLLVISANIINLVIVYNYFPDKILSRGLKITHWIFLITGSVITIGLLLMAIAGFMEEFLPSNPEDGIGKELVLFFFFFSLLEIYKLSFQFQVESFLKRNYRRSLNSLIESIGT